MLLPATLPACGGAHARRADELAQAQDWDAAVEEYRLALLDDPGNGEVAAGFERAQREAAATHRAKGKELASAGDFDGAVAALERASRLDPGRPEDQQALSASRARRDEVHATLAEARRRLGTGDPVGALDALAPVLGFRAANIDVNVVYEQVRPAATQALRDRAQRRLATGDIAAANDDLARAAGLDRDGAPAGTGSGTGSGAGAPGDGTVPASAGKAGEIAAGALDAYARAAADVQRLTRELPRRKPGGGIAKPEEYAVPEDRIAELAGAIERANIAKPAAERVPTWLAHGRLCLRMSMEVAALRHTARARELGEAGDAAAAWRELATAHRIDPDAVTSPEAEASVGAARRAIAARLLAAAERELSRGCPSLARLRIRQAREIGAADPKVSQDLEDRAAALATGPAVVLMPFQNYTSADDIAARLEGALLGRIGRGGSGSAVLSFDAYRKRKEGGRLPPITAFVRGDVLRIEVRDALDPEAARERVAAHRSAVGEARRRVAAASGAEGAGDGGGRKRAQAALDEAERALARAERERAAGEAAVARPGRPGEKPLAATVELRFQLHDPDLGRDVIAEPVVRALEGSAAKRADLEQRLLDDAVEPIAAAIEARFFDLRRAAAAPQDPRKALEAQVAALDRTPAGKAPDAVAAAAVLEATGWSYVQRRTFPERLRVE